MPELLIFGPGYTATRIAAAATMLGWSVTRAGRTAGEGQAALDDADEVHRLIARASHILSSVPPDGDADPVLARHGAALAAAPARWIGYLSSTGVYGDAGGAWVDESAPTGSGRRSARTQADRTWAALHPAVRVFRLPGIYGPGRSMLERVREGRAHITALPEQIFSRVHVDDIVAAVIASTRSGPAGLYNIADDLPAPQDAVVTEACRLMEVAPPAPVDIATLSPAARAFYAENRRVANGKAKRLLGWTPAYPDYRAGLRALNAMTSPASASTPPPIASGVQR